MGRRHMDDSVIGYERLYTTARRFYRAGSPMFHAWSWEKTFERRVKWDHELQMKWLSGFGS